MKNLIVLIRAAALSAVFAVASFAASAVPLKFSVVNDRADLIYGVGDEASFTVTATDTNGNAAVRGTVEVCLDNFGPKKVLQKTVDLSEGNPFTVRGRLDEPGFLRMRLVAKGSEPFNWGVGYAPEKIRKGSPSPDDFDEFWRAARARLAREVPLDAKMVRVPERCQRDFEFFRISFATFGRRVHGYMSVPTNKEKAPYPVEFSVFAAGFGNWTNDMSGSPDRIKVAFSVYPFEPDWKWKELGLKARLYDAMNDACRAKWGTIYSQAGVAKSREDYFFYPVLLGIDRAVDWVAARDDVNRSRFCYAGTSQGGGFGFYLTGLNRAFTRAAFFVPAITDTMGYLKGRQSGWPSIIESQPEDKRAAAELNAPYFDGANFASRIRCPVRVAVGFSDTTCAPCAVYAAYNEIAVADKSILHGFGMTHSCFGKFYEELGNWLMEE